MITAHRRENLGELLKGCFLLYKNPIVRKIAEEIFGDMENIKLIELLEVLDFHNFLNKSYLI